MEVQSCAGSWQEPSKHASCNTQQPLHCRISHDSSMGHTRGTFDIWHCCASCCLLTWEARMQRRMGGNWHMCACYWGPTL